MDGLNSLGWQIHDHLKKHRPSLFRQLKREGRLNRYVLEQQRWADSTLSSLEQQGMYPHEAMEMLRDQIFPPCEADVPSLGGVIEPYRD